jgi:hypothetical protein
MRTSFHHQPEAQHPNFPLSTTGRPITPSLSPNPTEGQPHQAHSDNDIGIPSDLCGPNISMPQIEHRSVSNRVTVIAHLFYR